MEMKAAIIIILVLTCFLNVSANEVTALQAFKSNLVDPDQKLKDWDFSLVNPCTWHYVTCDDQKVTVIKLLLGNFNLSGPLASELGQLSNLKELKLNNNRLSGEIPRSLTAISSLNNLNFSFNQLTGDVPVNGSFAKFTNSSFTGNPQLRMPAIRPPTNSPGSKVSIGAIAGGVAAGIVLLIAASILTFIWKQRRKRKQSFIDIPDENYPELSQGQLKRFSFKELQIATDNFSNKNFIGKGGFANVYKGRMADGTLVAVKRLKEECAQGGEIQFQTEVEMISLAIHRNLIRLYGFCTTPVERLLVYPLMTNGSVTSCLRERSAKQLPLSWEIRKRIALGVARGLAYLHEHCDPKIIHRDVKTDNIFLDDEYEAVVGDFGLAKLMDYKNTHVITKVCGTVGHIAPEYFSTGKSSEKTDVFGYGAMLLELITGQRATHLLPPANQEDITWLEWVKGVLDEKKLETLVDGQLKGNYIQDEAEHLIKIALLCRQTSPFERPKMSEVVRMLEGDELGDRWERWQVEEMLSQKSKRVHKSNISLVTDSTSNLSPLELSGAR